ncbi:NAD(P)/FAD-dependent oxidoreductase [Dyadobacter bucti]|uniref:NAD(P)/FAD-dependent oxidoreductase n=1 Tax=Dyadobacter bucti TaxID=2572203 RepID=UPI001109874C|nr:FAD-binding oxidoreductase [Dyadobacter bucti]
MADFDYLIVGQGIAGTSLAWHLHDAGKNILIVNDITQPSSSHVAAGIFNPLTGKKLVKTWLADDLFPYAGTFYSDLENRLGARFQHYTSIFRPFRSIEEQNTYLAQTADPGISRYVQQEIDPAEVSKYIHADYGGLEVTRSGWIDLPLMLEKSREFFKNEGHYSEELFDVADLDTAGEGPMWKGMAFGKVILCQGFKALENPFFNWLPFTPVKGQLLEIDVAENIKPYVINQGIFILPVSETRCKVGATYSWDPLDWQPAEAATKELESKLMPLMKLPYKIRSEVAGIRPSVRDRRPLVGIHPEHGNIGIFNGLGTKGVTLAPFFARQFAEHLENGKELNPLVNIKRYFSLYFH